MHWNEPGLVLLEDSLSRFRACGKLSVAMGTHLQHLDPDLLASQTDWLRRLARRLVRNEDLAEDVVQETMLHALQRPPTGTSSESGLRAWLSGVARNLARMSRRTEGRRVARESAYATSRRAHAPASDDVVERATQARRLMDAVLSLDEPYRRAVLFAYEEQLSAAAIAKRMDVTPELARKRISRGLAQLRVLLAEQDEEDRHAWLSGLAVLCKDPALGPALWTGGIMMSTKIAALAAACVLFLAFGMWAFRDGGEDGSSLDPVVAGSPAGSPSEPPAGVAEPSTAQPVVEEAAKPRVSIAVDAPTATPTTRAIRGRLLLNDDLTPVRGARILAAAAGVDEPTQAPNGETLAEDRRPGTLRVFSRGGCSRGSAGWGSVGST